MSNELAKIEIVKGDITNMQVDAIVNSAKKTLRGGGGVDGAIHDAAGPDLLKECEALGGCEIGDAKITKGYRLPAKHVIHAVGPRWCGGNEGEADALARCHTRALELAWQRLLRSVAFPAISCGIYGYPLEQAAEIALGTVAETLPNAPSIERVYFALFDESAHRVFNAIFNQMRRTGA